MLDYLQKSKAHLFVSSLDDTLEIFDDDAHHLLRVLRLKVCDKITCASDSKVREYEISNATKTSLTIAAIREVQEVQNEEIRLVLSLFKFDRMEIAIAKAVEAGVSEIVLTRTQFSSTKIDQNKLDKIMSRFKAIIYASAAQSRRSILPNISYEPNLKTIVTKYHDIVICAPEGSSKAFNAPVTLLIGPEGGFGEDDEKLIAEKIKWKISQNIFRAETAAIVAVALVSYNQNN